MKLLFIAGVLCVLYFCGISLFAGAGTNFYYIFLVLGIVLMVIAWVGHRGLIYPHLPVWLKRSAVLCTVIGMFFLLLVEVFIFSGFFAKGKEDLSYLIVLGAQMKKKGPSVVLRMRLDKAVAYLEENGETMVIVSGGQGPNEPVSEALGMRDYMVKQGIDADRIIMEDRSTTTKENIQFSSELLDREQDSVGIVTNNFHVFRATSIAKKSGFKDVCGIAAGSNYFMLLNNMFREFFGVVKDIAVGNM